MNFTFEFKSTSPLKEVHSEENPLQRLTYRLFRTNIDESKHVVCNAYINIHHPLKLLTSSDGFRHFFVRSVLIPRSIRWDQIHLCTDKRSYGGIKYEGTRTI